MNRTLSALLCSASFAFCHVAIAQEGPLVATLDSVEGAVQKKEATGANFAAATVGVKFHKDDVIHTERASRAGVVFASGVLLRIAPNTTLEFHGSGQEGVGMPEGKAYLFNRGEKDLPVIDTPSVSAAIRGTELVIESSKDRTTITVLDGAVDCKNKFGELSLHKGEVADTVFGHAPVKRIVVNPTDAVQWALNYPWVVVSEDSASGATGDQELLLRAKRSIGSGEVADGEHALQSLRGDAPASIRAAVQAELAVIKIIQNKKPEAEALAQKALGISPTSASAALALSYVAQSNSKIDEASCWIDGALGSSAISTSYSSSRGGTCSEWISQNGGKTLSSDTTLRARRAELALASGDLETAERLAKSLPPEEGGILRGFIALAHGDAEGAKGEFVAAIKRDGNDGLGHIGLGLSIIRQGDLSRGREELERAVYLEPTMSVYRSYLGKAYFEGSDATRALHEFDQATSLDPRDPSPYIYRALTELSQNKPVLALRDVEASIERNDNRGVYRSKLLLDQDSAIRSAKLSEVFTTLGFDDVGRIEAIRSLSQDYENYTAHRLLSDSYQSGFIALDDVSRSERRIATLLSPLSFNLLAGADAGINDYNAVFDKSEERIYATASYEKHDDVLINSLSAAGRGEKTGYFTTFDSELRGGRVSHGFAHLYHAGGAFQYQPDFEDHFIVKADGRFTKEVEQGAYDEFRQEESEFSLGYHGILAPDLHLLAEVGYRNPRKDLVSNQVQRPLFVDDQVNEQQGDTTALINEISRERVKAYSGDAQIIYASSLVSVVGGAEGVWSRPSREETSPILDGAPEIVDALEGVLRSKGYNDLASNNFYLYPTFHLTSWADLTTGVDFSQVEYEEREIEPFVSLSRRRSALLPKFGLVLTPASGTTVRTSYSEGLRKSSLEDNSTLAPTLIGGINQIFTDLSGSRSRLTGVGIDQKIEGGTYLGIEGTHRHLIQPITPATSLIQLTEDGGSAHVGLDEEVYDSHNIDTIRGYVSQLLTDEWVASLKHEWSRTKGGDLESFKELGLHRSEAALRYFDPSGWFLETSATRREQKRFQSDLTDGTTSFWTFDAGVGYRLPNRHGSVVAKVTNILDKKFTYDQSLGEEPFVAQDVGVLLAASVNF